MSEARSGPLAGIAVVDISEGVAATFCAKILGDLGASVIRIEPTDGDAISTFDPSSIASYLFTNSSKKSIELALENSDGKSLFRQLLETHDVVIASDTEKNLEDAGLGYSKIASWNRRAILATITGFGSDGPYADWVSSPIITNAMGGWANTCGLTDREPLLAGRNLSEFVAGAYGAAAVLGAVIQRDKDGIGQHVDVSAMEAAITAALLPTLVYEYSGVVPVRDSSRATGPSWMMECRDGYVGANVLTPLQWQAMCQLLGADDLIDAPEYLRPADRASKERELRSRFAPWFKCRNAADVFHEAQSWRLPFGLVPSLTEVLSFEQHRDRGFFIHMPDPTSDRTVAYPGIPFRMSATPSTPAPPPAIGEDTDNILLELLGLGEGEISQLRADGIIGDNKEG